MFSTVITTAKLTSIRRAKANLGSQGSSLSLCHLFGFGQDSLLPASIHQNLPIFGSVFASHLTLLEFTGLEAVTWTCLDNHYHLLLRVPNALEGKLLRGALPEEDILARMPRAYSSTYIDNVKKRLAYYRANGNEALANTIVERLRSQLFDVAAFMHMLKRRFSAWFNKRHGRKGTLWEGRYRSSLIQDGEESLLQIAAYLDLNAVRAGIVEDPKDYRWCGYAEAVAGISVAQNRLVRLLSEQTGAASADEVSPSPTPATNAWTWNQAHAAYRNNLGDSGAEVRDETGALIRHGLTREAVTRIQEAAGTLTRGQRLRCQLRFFAQGVFIGSQSFMETCLSQYAPLSARSARPNPNQSPPNRFVLCT